jgi:hypothetical protein
MNVLDLLITFGILLWFGTMIYCKISRKTVKDLILEFIDLIKSMREKND